MSRGFVKEDDQEEVPIVPPRADLPPGVTNYVTQAGYEELEAEKKELIEERESLEGANEKERRIAVNHINSKLQLLNARIASAHIIDLEAQPQDEVRFGATVTFRIGAENQERKFQIVGVDEADVSKGKIAFISPLAKALTNKTVGETAVLKLLKEERKFKILGIAY